MKISRWLSVLALLITPGAIAPTARAAPDDKLDLSSVIGGNGAGEKSDPLAEEMKSVGAGDKKAFTIKTDDNLANLKPGDVYTDGAKTYFTVVSVGQGEFVITRTAGTGNPDRKLQRVSSVDERNRGPDTIVARQTLLDLYVQGGPFLHPIAILGVVLIVLAINGAVVYRAKRQIPPAFATEALAALERGDVEKFEAAANRERGLLPAVCRAMADRFDSSTAEDVERRVQVAAAGQINRLRTPIKLMNLISVAAPLLGLLGTIVGMVIVFEAVARTTGAAKATALAAGIRVKLFSTAAALCVAIPSLFLYFFFNTKLGNLIAETERLSEQMLHQVILIKRRKTADKAAKTAAKSTAADTAEASV
jgi:biopolymer transport protein ExbB